VFIHRIIARDTVDELVLERLTTKRRVQDVLLDAMKKEDKCQRQTLRNGAEKSLEEIARQALDENAQLKEDNKVLLSAWRDLISRTRSGRSSCRRHRLRGRLLDSYRQRRRGLAPFCDEQGHPCRGDAEVLSHLGPGTAHV
jgi:hypothetical protein